MRTHAVPVAAITDIFTHGLRQRPPQRTAQAARRARRGAGGRRMARPDRVRKSRNRAERAEAPCEVCQCDRRAPPTRTGTADAEASQANFMTDSSISDNPQ